MNQLAKPRILARGALLLEAVWPALWPPLGIIGVFLCAALLDLPALLPAWAHIGALVATGGALGTLLVRASRAIRLPDKAAVDRRLEAASGLAHRPLSVLTDQPARMDPAGMALWQAHVARAARQIGNLKVGPPRPGLPRRDPRALRAGLVVALAACAVVAGADGPGRIAAALRPAGVPLAAPTRPEVRAWITPPPYTRLPPIFLRPDLASVLVPAGSHLTVSLTGAGSAASLALDGRTDPFQPLDAGSFQAERDLTSGGQLSVRLDGLPLASWTLTVIADTPPTIIWNAPPARAQGSQQIRLPWKTEDDYGVVSLEARILLEPRPDAPPLVVALPLPGGGGKTAKGVSQQDLTAHPWAGLPVTITLVGRDFPGQTGSSDAARLLLPERSFQNPIARALIAVRKGLSLHPDDRGDEMEALDTLLQTPEAFGDDLGAVLNLSGIYHKLVRDPSPEGIAEAQERLWQLALHMEEGRTEATARALEEARQAAREALETLVQTPSDANREALDERMKELQEAIDRHMQALTEEANRNGEPMPQGPDGRPLTQKELDKQTDRTRESAREGRNAEAQSRMAELERMLDRLRDAKPGQQDKQRAEQRQRGRQQMGAVQDMIAREGGLLDHAESRVDQNRRSRTAPGESNAEREADQRVQQALRRALGELMQQFGDLTGEIPPSLSEADQAMHDATRQLGMGRDQAAGESVQQAIAALQKGAQEMGQAMARKFGPPRPGPGGEDGDGDEALFGMTMPGTSRDGQSNGSPPTPPRQADSRGRDPLGRPTTEGVGGSEESGDTLVPEERERQKTLAIQEELRRRGADRQRPQPELDYIDRLLKQF